MTIHRRPRQNQPSALPPPQRQLSMMFEARVLGGMTPRERANVITHLTTLLLQAANVMTEGRDDDEQ